MQMSIQDDYKCFENIQVYVVRFGRLLTSLLTAPNVPAKTNVTMPCLYGQAHVSCNDASRELVGHRSNSVGVGVVQRR